MSKKNLDIARFDISEAGDLYAKRKKVYPRQVTGIFARMRASVVWILLGIYYLSPWLTWNGNQAILFDLPARKFYIFGITFWPQDLFFLSWLLIIAALSLFFFTAIAGRLWCGYACPQTVWTEAFLWMERLVEGDRNKRMKLDKQGFSTERIIKKTIKHSIWIIFATWTGFTFVGFFVPIQDFSSRLIEFNLGGWEWFWFIFYSFATYGNAGKLREQVCIYMCPYARFQSAMFDKDTLIIAYDEERGESRGSRKRSAEPKELGLGDCIDCKQCVHVCPTGIDIRDGLQYECIACAGCIDVCNQVMDKMGYERGLVRYTSLTKEKTGKFNIFRPRVLLYGSLLILLCLSFLYTVYNRIPFELDIIRDRNRLYIENLDGLIENTYTLRVMNMSQADQSYMLDVSGIEGLELIGSNSFTLEAGEVESLPIRLQVDPVYLKRTNTKIEFHVKSANDDTIDVKEFGRFIGPRMR